MALVTCEVFPSRIMLPMAGEAKRISTAATRPPPTLGMSCCATTPRIVSPRTLRTPSCSGAGKTLMMRSIVLAALFVCSVPKTSVPRSAAERAMVIVSRSRISPTRTTSGSSRPAALSDAAHLIGQPELLQRQDLRGDDPEDGAPTPLLPEEIDAVARHPRNLVREIDVAALEIFIPQPLRRDRLEHLRKIDVGDRPVADRFHQPRSPQHRRTPHGEVKVRRPAVVHQLEEAIDLLRRHYVFPRAMNSSLTIDSKSSFLSAAIYAVSAL